MSKKVWINDSKSGWILIEYLSSGPAVSPSALGEKKSAALLVKHNSIARLGPHTTYECIDGTSKTVPNSSIALYNSSHSVLHDDITLLDDMHAASVLNLLSLRFGADKVYTNIGQIVVAVNPYRRINNLYDLPYSGESDGPHIFAVSERAYESLWKEEKNQIIIVNGESGAGKTESTKIMLRHLTFLSSELEAEHEEEIEFDHIIGIGRIDGGDSDDDGDTIQDGIQDAIQDNQDHRQRGETKESVTSEKATNCRVDDLVLSSNAVCEAFGNAKTIHNNNSSRFGKFLSLHFSPTSKCIDSCSVHHFVLEKSRVVQHAQDERSYHSFYQMVHGANSKQRKDWKLRKVEEYNYLTPTKTIVRSQKRQSSKQLHLMKNRKILSSINPEEDKSNFQTTLRSLSDIGFNQNEINSLYKLLSGILLLGNLEFVCSSGSGNNGFSVLQQDKRLHNELSELFGLSNGKNIFSVLSKATTRRIMEARRGSITEIQLSVQDAKASRDGLAKFLYSGIFDYIFHRLNIKGCSGSNHGDGHDGNIDGHTIGILDIFGFEIVPKNSFEQLVINYSNEKLQSIYNDFIFSHELKQYQEEGIDVSNMVYSSNLELIQLLDKRPIGIFQLLDDQCMRGGSDSAFLANVNQAYTKNSSPNSFFAKPRFGGEAFVIKHFAGDVIYETEEFIKKNNDAIHSDLRALLDQCTSPLIQSIVAADVAIINKADKEGLNQPGGSNGSTKKMLTKRSSGTKLTGTRTVGNQIRNEIKKLKNIIDLGSPHFVRCIKPNKMMEPAPSFNKPLVIQQLKFLGLMETCKIRRQGFPVQRCFIDLVVEYGCLIGIDESIENIKNDSSLVMRDACVSILQKYACITSEENNFQREQSTGMPTGMAKPTPTSSPTSSSLSFNKQEDLFRVGNTKVFLRDGVLQTLNIVKSNWEQQRMLAANRIQSKIRQRRAYKKVQALLLIQRQHSSAVKIQSLFRGNKDRLRARNMKRERDIRLQNEAEWDASIILQKIMKGHVTRKRDLISKLRNEKSKETAAVKVQALMRSQSMRRVYSKKQNSAVKIASFFRKKRSQAKFGVSRNSAILIQTAIRRQLTMKAYKKKLQDLLEKNACIKIQTFYRCESTRYLYEQKVKCTVKIQSKFRSYRTCYRFKLLANIRRPWTHLLAPNEILLRVSYCVKYAGTGIGKMIGIKRRRLLFLTSAGRVIYSNPFSKKKQPKLKGEFKLSLRDNFGVNMLDESTFEFIATSRKYKFFDLFDDSKGWLKMTKVFLNMLHDENPILVKAAAALENVNEKDKVNHISEAKIPPLSMSTVLFSHTIDPLYAYLKQGRLMKCSTKKNKTRWYNRWFILHGERLYWFSADGTGKPRGKVIINSKSVLKTSADRDFCFKLITPLFPDGILLAASSNDEKKMWERSFKRTIFSCASKVDRRIRKHHREKSQAGEITDSLADFRKSYVSVVEEEDVGFDSGDEDEVDLNETSEMKRGEAYHVRQKSGGHLNVDRKSLRLL